LVDKFGISYLTVSKISEVVHKQDKSLCPPKKAKKRTRKDVALEAIALVKKEGKKK